MNCNKCDAILVKSNLNREHDEDIFYTRYFCFRCNTLYECYSWNGDMTEENLIDVGKLEW